MGHNGAYIQRRTEIEPNVRYKKKKKKMTYDISSNENKRQLYRNAINCSASSFIYGLQDSLDSIDLIHSTD